MGGGSSCCGAASFARNYVSAAVKAWQHTRCVHCIPSSALYAQQVRDTSDTHQGTWVGQTNGVMLFQVVSLRAKLFGLPEFKNKQTDLDFRLWTSSLPVTGSKTVQSPPQTIHRGRDGPRGLLVPVDPTQSCTGLPSRSKEILERRSDGHGVTVLDGSDTSSMYTS